MDMQQPKFVDSEFFVPTPGNWHLKPGAPAEILREFTEFMAAQAQQHSEEEFELFEVDPDDD